MHTSSILSSGYLVFTHASSPNRERYLMMLAQP